MIDDPSWWLLFFWDEIDPGPTTVFCFFPSYKLVYKAGEHLLTSIYIY